MISAECRLRLRPSIAFVPRGDDQYQFFQGNTRRSAVYKIEPALAAIIPSLDGTGSLAQLADTGGIDIARLLSFAWRLMDRCILEDVTVAKRISRSQWRRVLNFLADYLPSSEIEEGFGRVRETHVVVLGAGAIGTWVAVQLAHSGIRSFTIVDDDVVERSNLNRSLFTEEDVGVPKVEALAKRLSEIANDGQCHPVRASVAESGYLSSLLAGLSSEVIVVNCADWPSVDATSGLVDRACQQARVPYVIAGGYNLHLSLIGLTVIPGESACYECSRINLEERQADDLRKLRKLDRPWRNVGNLAPLAGITASFAAMEVIRLAVRSPRLRPSMLNRRGEFNFLTNRIHFVDLPPRRECGCVKTD